MKEIKAYKCGFCNKVYEKRSSCKSHEYKCYFNPKTKSCSGCAFLLEVAIEVSVGTHFEFNACSLNHDIMRKLKTKCPDFADKKDMKNILKYEEMSHEHFDKKKAALNALKYFKEIKKLK